MLKQCFETKPNGCQVDDNPLSQKLSLLNLLTSLYNMYTSVSKSLSCNIFYFLLFQDLWDISDFVFPIISNQCPQRLNLFIFFDEKKTITKSFSIFAVNWKIEKALKETEKGIIITFYTFLYVIRLNSISENFYR